MTLNESSVSTLPRINQNASHVPTKRKRLCSLALICLFVGCVARGQREAPASLKTVVRVSVTSELKRYWQIREAGLTEELSGTIGYVALQNVSGTTLDRSVVYAEYFDAADRFCFSMTFSLAKNIGDRTPVPPGGTRTVYSANTDLLSASRPTVARIYLLREREIDQTHRVADEPIVRAPATLNGAIPSDDSTLQLPPEIASEKGPLVDLILAMLVVNERGQIMHTRIMHAASPSLETWFLSFASKLSFYPATHSNVPLASVAVINVMAMLSKEASRDSLIPASDLPWVKQYAAQFAASEIPPVTQIVFGPPATKTQLPGRSGYTERPPGPPGMLEVMILLSDWSNPCYEWVRDESKPQHLTRKLGEDIPQ